MTAIMQRETSALQLAAQANQLFDFGNMLIKSGMLPNSVRTPEAAVTIMVKGMELGLPPMAALNGITVIQGKKVRPRRAILLNSNGPALLQQPGTVAPYGRDKVNSSKVCRKCGIGKPLEAFSPNKKRRDGRQSYCRGCVAQNAQEKRAADPEATRAKSRAYYAADRVGFCARAKRHADAHREEIRAKANEQRAANPDATRAAERARYWNKPGEYRATALAYWHSNRECQIARQMRRSSPQEKQKGRDAVRFWRQRNPLKVKQATQNRRALLQAAPGFFSAADLNTIYEQQGGKCSYCGVGLQSGFSVDHVIPLSRGGSNWPENLACACLSCNASKGAKTPAEFAIYRGQVQL